MTTSRGSRRLAAVIAAVLVVAGAIAAGLIARKPRARPRETFREASLLLITLDTTRADHLDCYADSPAETPHLDALARDGVRFDRAIASAPLTVPAHTTLMTGRWPSSHGVRDNAGFALRSDATTLAETLRAAGFATHAVVGSFVLGRDRGLDQGFEEYDDRLEDGAASSALHVERNGSDVADRGIRWLTDHARSRFFLWLHFYDPHYPYEPKGDLAVRFASDPYSGEITHVDRQVGRVLETLKALGLDDRTLVVAVGDHGEGLEDHGEPQHGVFLYQPTIRVPLIVRTPGRRDRGVVPGVVRDVDLLPTVLDALGLPPPKDAAGSSLLPLMAGATEAADRLAYSETFYTRFHFGWSELRSIQDSRFKYVDAPRPELYDLESDPGETRNLHDADPDVAERLKRALEEIPVGDPEGARSEAADALDPETRSKLAALGYVGSRAPSRSGPLPDPKDKREALGRILDAAGATLADLRRGDYRPVIERTEALLREEPDYVEGYGVLSDAYRRVGRPDQAVRVLEAALRVDPTNDSFRESLAESYLEARHPDAARAILESLVARSPQAVLPRVTLATLLAQQGHLDAAEEMIRRALEIKDTVPEAHFNLALIAEQRGRPQEAIAEYEKEVSAFPQNHAALVNLGLLHSSLGRPDLAVEDFRRAVEARPRLFAGRFLLARELAAVGRLDEAEQHAAEAVAIDPGSERARALVLEIKRARGARTE